MASTALALLVPMALGLSGYEYYRRKQILMHPVMIKALETLEKNSRVTDFIGDDPTPGYIV